MNTDKTHTAVTCTTTTKTLQNTKKTFDIIASHVSQKTKVEKTPPKSQLHTTIDQIPVYYRNQKHKGNRAKL